MPPSDATSQYQPVAGSGATPTTGKFSGLPPMELYGALFVSTSRRDRSVQSIGPP
jgi:hypothetical protein